MYHLHAMHTGCFFQLDTTGFLDHVHNFGPIATNEHDKETRAVGGQVVFYGMEKSLKLQKWWTRELSPNFVEITKYWLY